MTDSINFTNKGMVIMNSKIFSPRVMAVIVTCASLNAGIGILVQLLKLPLYLDLVGSILAVVLVGLLPGIIAAALGSVILSVVITPTAIAYIGTAIIVTATSYWFVGYGYLRNIKATIFFGLLLGLVSAIVSAPVTAYIYGGVTFVGADAFTAFFRAMGESLMTSVILGGISIDPVDKIITSIICYSIWQALPNTLTATSSSH